MAGVKAIVDTIVLRRNAEAWPLNFPKGNLYRCGVLDPGTAATNKMTTHIITNRNLL